LQREFEVEAGNLHSLPQVKAVRVDPVGAGVEEET
jgi:hypothetical protein